MKKMKTKAYKSFQTQKEKLFGCGNKKKGGEKFEINKIDLLSHKWSKLKKRAYLNITM